MISESSQAAPARGTRGVVLVLGAGLIWSTSGPLIRGIEAADVWQILFFKMLWFHVALTVLLVLRYRQMVIRVLFDNIRWTTLAALCLVVSNVGWILSITTTTVANTLLLQAATPFFAAMLAWVALKERSGRSTWIAMGVAIAGIAVMIGDGAVDGRLFGNVAAIVATLGFAAFAVVLRAGRMADSTTALWLCSAIAFGVAGVMAGDFDVTLRDHVLCFVMGAPETGVGLILFTMGARLVPAAELVLLTLIETALGPLFVWLLFAEVPSAGTLAGGTLVIAAIVGQVVVGMRATGARRSPS
ncbi:MAG: DMT family transporter [Alphaproteobacteria bacterium]|nr:DMT family transporter [Alphaproteobacteria bacterium]